MRPRLKGHDVIHAALLVDQLRDHFTPAWQEEFATALDHFLLNLKGASKVEESDPKYRYWSRYGKWTRVNSDRGENISLRHSFYVAEILAKCPQPASRTDHAGFQKRYGSWFTCNSGRPVQFVEAV